VELGASIVGDSTGGSYSTRNWDLTEIPRFIAPNSIIATLPRFSFIGKTGVASKLFPAIEWVIYPGQEGSKPNVNGSPSTGWVYDDDGMTNKYITSKPDYLFLGTNWSDSKSFVLTMSTNSKDSAFIIPRPYFFKVMYIIPPVSITHGGKAIPFAKFNRDPLWYPASTAWSYDPVDLAVVIYYPTPQDIRKAALEITLKFDDAKVLDQLSGVRGVIQHAKVAKEILDEVRVDRHQIWQVSHLSILGQRLSNNANNIKTYRKWLSTVADDLKTAIDEVAKCLVKSQLRKDKATALLKEAQKYLF
jgi:hypothetical protein